jgi:predicted amidophosphoribosyltransferase
MPIPFIIWAAGALLVAGGAALVVSNSKKKNSSGGDDEDDGEEEQGSLEDRLKKRCREHTKNQCYFFERYYTWRNRNEYTLKINDLKNKDKKIISEFVEKFRFLKGLDNLVIIRVPSHKAGKENGVEFLAARISRKYGISDMSWNLKRISEVPQRKQAKKGERYMDDAQKQDTKKSLKITDPKKLDGKDILLIDDIATTWDTIDCCESVIRDANPREIYSLVLGRTNPPRRS